MAEKNSTESNELDFRESLENHFRELKDYRRENSVSHSLINILFITICAVISGANTLKAVAIYAERKQPWLEEILRLDNGVPSYTTFWMVFALLVLMHENDVLG